MSKQKLIPEELKELLEKMVQLPYIPVEEIPNIDLYMDQVTTLMDKHLGSGKRRSEEKVLTKTMINNYAKNHLLPPPVKKKYSREHLLLMLFIYYFKGFLSLQDIQTLLEPLAGRFYQSTTGPDITDIYKQITKLGAMESKCVKEDAMRLALQANETFTDVPEKDRIFLQYFALICQLSLRVYMEKRLIEQLIDRYCEEPEK